MLNSLSQIYGQEHVKRALEVAAAGGHNLMMSGPPGAGKTLIARSMPGILPRMSIEEALDVTWIYSVADQLSPDEPMIRPTAALLGASLAPDDAYLALRGLRTLPLRLARHQQNGLAVARWLQTRPEVREVLHPALPDFCGHELAQRQLSGYGSLFSFRLQPAPAKAHHAFVDALELFLIGVSWGGYESLILPLETAYPDDPGWRARRRLDDDTFRTSIGLEDPEDLIADLERGFAAWRAGWINR